MNDRLTVPFLCIGLAFLLVYLARIPVMIALARAPGGYDNRHPRDAQARLEGWGRRAQAAHQNSIEGFAPFAASVFVAHLGRASAGAASALAVTYVVSRLVYVALYIGDVATMLSAIWGLGMTCIAGLFALPLLAPG